MSVMNVLRRAALPAAAGLSVSCLLATGAPAQAAPAGLHAAATIDLGRLGTSFSYQFSEDPSGNVYYARGSVVYVVKGSKRPAVALRAGAPVLAVAANPTDLFVEAGRTVTAYNLSNHHRVRSWKLPSSPSAPTSAGLYVVGTTIWAWTDWATDQSGFEYASVTRFGLSSATVHKVSSNNVYPGDMSANSAGLYFEAVRTQSGNGYLIHATPSGTMSRKRADKNIDAPLALADGNVYLLAIHEPSGNTYLDSFNGSTLGVNFSVPESSKYTEIADTGAGLLILGGGNLRVLIPATGHTGATLGIRRAVTLLSGPSAGVITYSGGKTYLVRVVLTG